MRQACTDSKGYSPSHPLHTLYRAQLTIVTSLSRAQVIITACLTYKGLQVTRIWFDDKVSTACNNDDEHVERTCRPRERGRTRRVGQDTRPLRHPTVIKLTRVIHAGTRLLRTFAQAATFYNLMTWLREGKEYGGGEGVNWIFEGEGG